MIDFLIIAFTVFVIVKVVKTMQVKAEIAKEKLLSKIKAEEEAKALEEEKSNEEASEEVVIEEKPTVEELLTEIRDLIKK